MNGGWGEWGDWSECTQQCRDGRKIRERECDSPKPQNGGRQCRGDDKEAKPCEDFNLTPCPGEWNLLYS